MKTVGIIVILFVASTGPAVAASGTATYESTCAICHTSGADGAPKLGDKAAWGPRLKAGKSTLYQHAISGFTGKTGMMPPKGGDPSLTEADVKAAVDFMASKAR